MSSLNQFKSHFIWLAVVIIFASAAVAALEQSPFKSYANSKAQALITEGDGAKSSNPNLALSDYRLANIINRHGAAADKAADLYLELDRPDDAIAALNTAKPVDQLKIAQIQFDSSQLQQALKTLNSLSSNDKAVVRLKIQTLIELNQTKTASVLASQAYRSLGDQNSGLLLGLLQLIIGGTTSAQDTITSLGSHEAAITLQQASSGNVNLAKVLYAQGLIRASERVVKTQLDSSEAYLLLAQINLSSKHPNREVQTTAINLLKEAEPIDPGNLTVHQLLKNVYEQVGDSANASREGELIDQLQTGKI